MTRGAIDISASPLIINLAPTGMIPSRKMTPCVPISPQEIVQDVLAAAEVGISMVHIHARDGKGRPTYKKEVYASIIAGIREHQPDLIICVSCSGRDFSLLEQRADVLNLEGDLKPDMASLTTSSLNFAKQVSINEPQAVLLLAERMLERDILPEIEILDLGMSNYARYLADKLGIRVPLYANILLGNIATAQADLLSIVALVQSLPPETLWSLGGIGDAQIPMTALASAMAPGVRIGLEDYLWLDRKRTRFATNLAMVQRMHHLAALADRPIMSAQMLRPLLGLKVSKSVKDLSHKAS
jgi:3-keto-5-aminohexanoate cleavage enzyme